MVKCVHFMYVVTFNDAYKLLVLPIPMKDGELTMDDTSLSPYVSTALQVVQENIGVLPYPSEVKSVEFSSSNSDDRDKVSDATSQMYANQGVSEALMSGASSGSELKLSITNDSADIFKIYRMLENWIALQMNVRGHIYPTYKFVYKILDITIFNQAEVIDKELKLAQASTPNKFKPCAASGKLYTSLRFHMVANGDNYIKTIKINRLIRVSNVQILYITFW